MNPRCANTPYIRCKHQCIDTLGPHGGFALLPWWHSFGKTAQTICVWCQFDIILNMLTSMMMPTDAAAFCSSPSFPGGWADRICHCVLETFVLTRVVESMMVVANNGSGSGKIILAHLPVCFRNVNHSSNPMIYKYQHYFRNEGPKVCSQMIGGRNQNLCWSNVNSHSLWFWWFTFLSGFFIMLPFDFSVNLIFLFVAWWGSPALQHMFLLSLQEMLVICPFPAATAWFKI